MDPNTTAAIMRNEALPLHERIDAARALLDWLDKGGFPQSLYDHKGRHVSFGGNTAARFAAREEAQGYFDLLSEHARQNAGTSRWASR